MIHGYDYKFIESPSYPDRHQTWVKVPMIREALKNYDYVIFMDHDAVFNHDNLPLEWLFNYWNLTNETLVAMATDPVGEVNSDERGNVNVNTGFIIAQASERTMEMFDIWENCISDDRFANCSKWAYNWPHEQAAFSNFLRYEYSDTEVVSLSCTEANGYPEVVGTGCVGEFVRHFWGHKALTVSTLQNSTAQYMAHSLHNLFHKQLSHTFVNASDTSIPLEDGVEIDV